MEKRRKGEKEETERRKNLNEIEDSKLTFGGVNNKNKVESGVVSVNRTSKGEL